MHPDDDETTPDDDEATAAKSNLTDALGRFTRFNTADAGADEPNGDDLHQEELAAANDPEAGEEGEANGDADEESGEADEPAEAETPGEDADAGEAAGEAADAEEAEDVEAAVAVEPAPVADVKYDDAHPGTETFIGDSPVTWGGVVFPTLDESLPEEDAEDFDWEDFDDDDWDIAEYNLGYAKAIADVLAMMDDGTDVILSDKCNAIRKMAKRGRDAGTGQFITVEEAEANKGTAVVETYEA